MGVDRLLQVVAAVAAACGVFAVVTGSGWAGAVAGLSSVVCAGLVLRANPAWTGLRREPSINLRGQPSTTAVPSLMGEDYLDATLRGRIAVAKRALRPLSVVHVEILTELGESTLLAAHLIADAAETTLRASDVVGRRADGVYVFILEETGEDGAVWTTERLRRQVVETCGPRRFFAGVASYPNHALDAETIDLKAAEALASAREWGRDRIEVAANR